MGHEKRLKHVKLSQKKSITFFIDFANFIPVEIFHIKHKLCMQSFIIVGQTVPEIHEERQILSFELQLCQKTVKEGKQEA